MDDDGDTPGRDVRCGTDRSGGRIRRDRDQPFGGRQTERDVNLIDQLGLAEQLGIDLEEA